MRVLHFHGLSPSVCLTFTIPLTSQTLELAAEGGGRVDVCMCACVNRVNVCAHLWFNACVCACLCACVCVGGCENMQANAI